MNIEEERKRFEKVFPVPAGVKWEPGLKVYYPLGHDDSGYDDKFRGWLAAKRDTLRPPRCAG